uniref:ZAD domain-containing protein n=1 Tax=Anopheles minimus TaxID=112268 RepID=A0A182W0K7_9DIPT
MELGLVVPTSEEKDFCQFCFGAANLHLLFPLDRPELLSIIDNIIGISIDPQAHESFSLCDECIATMDMFITFRNKCRSHYEKVREVKIMNQAVKRMFPVLRDSTVQPSPINASAANTLDTRANGGTVTADAPSEEKAETIVRAENDHCNESARKRSYTQCMLDFDSDPETKRARIPIGSNHKVRYHHIREIMNRFRINRLSKMDGSKSPTIAANIQNENGNTNGDALLNDGSSRSTLIPCKPCVVVVQKCSAHLTDTCKS